MTFHESDPARASIEGLHEPDGPDEPHDDHPLFGPDDGEPSVHIPGARKRSDRRRHSRRRRRRFFPLLSLVVIAALVVASYLLVHTVVGAFRTPDYTGNGLGYTRITIAPGDGAQDVAATMLKAGVVKSTRSFIDAAAKSGRAGDIQPGVYRVRLHSSGAAAMAAILDPANKLSIVVTIPEGYTEKQVLADLAQRTGLPLTALTTAAAQVANLGLPPAYKPGSAEGFLFPSTYNFNPGISADAAVQQLTAQFGTEDAKLGLEAAAKAARITPYQALIIASIIEAEVKFDSDRAKVARVILNRLAAGRPLQIDATSVYAAKLAGLDPAKVNFATINSPYNGYTHPGLPPTPIDNPGESSLEAAVHPTPGAWLYYVNDDAAGHLGFYTDENQFLAAAAVCQAHNWGCG